MKRFLVTTALALTWLPGCTPFSVSAPDLYGSLAVSNKRPQQTAQSSQYRHDHYAFTVSGKHIPTPLVTKVPAGVLPDDAEKVVFEKIPAGDVVIYGEVIALDLQTVLATISIPAKVEANKTTTVSIWSEAPSAPRPADPQMGERTEVRGPSSES